MPVPKHLVIADHGACLEILVPSFLSAVYRVVGSSIGDSVLSPLISEMEPLAVAF